MSVINNIVNDKSADNDSCIKVDSNNDNEDGNKNQIQHKICQLNRPSCCFIKC